MTTLDVVIASKNRPQLCERAIASIPEFVHEIYVVNDGSDNPNDYEKLSTISRVTVIHNDHSQGPGPARNIALNYSKANYVLILDDDDLLLTKEVQKLIDTLESQKYSEYPVLFFRTNKSYLSKDIILADLSELLSRKHTKGDFVPILNMNFKDEIFYPVLHIGFESLLWIKLSKKYLIPHFNIVILDYTEDAPNKLTSTENIISRAAEYTKAQIYALNYLKALDLGSVIQKKLLKIRLTALTYFIVSNKESSIKKLFKKELPVFYYLSFFIPKKLFIALFKFYKNTNKKLN